MKSPFHSITQGFRWMWMWLTRHLSRRENRFDFFLVNELWREKSLSSQNYETWHPGSHTQSLTLSYNISPTSTLVCRFERSVRGNLYSAEGGGSDSAPRTAQMIDSPHKKKLQIPNTNTRTYSPSSEQIINGEPIFTRCWLDRSLHVCGA